MGTSYTILETRQPKPGATALAKRMDMVSDAFGQIAVLEIRRDIWPISRFKRPTGKSTRAWAYLVSKGVGLVVYNPAVSKRGYNYPKVVHLAGRPKSERLMNEVVTYVQADLGKRLGRALAYAVIDEERKAAPKTTRTKIGG